MRLLVVYIVWVSYSEKQLSASARDESVMQKQFNHPIVAKIPTLAYLLATPLFDIDAL